MQRNRSSDKRGSPCVDGGMISESTDSCGDATTIVGAARTVLLQVHCLLLQVLRTATLDHSLP